jgi:hypothetical protein
LLLSINTNIVGKSPEAIRRFNASFENVDITPHELARLVHAGFAFSAQHTGSRRGANFLCAGFLALDIDDGLTIEAAEMDPFFQRHACLLYATASHTPDHHRFRVVFELEEPITDRVLMRDALTGLIARFGGDEACKDECRIFFGNPGCFWKEYK